MRVGRGDPVSQVGANQPALVGIGGDEQRGALEAHRRGGKVPRLVLQDSKSHDLRAGRLERFLLDASVLRMPSGVLSKDRRGARVLERPRMFGDEAPRVRQTQHRILEHEAAKVRFFIWAIAAMAPPSEWPTTTSQSRPTASTSAA